MPPVDPNALQKEMLFLKGKLNALSAIIRLGHEAFSKRDFTQWAAHVVNNSILALPYYRSALIDLRDGKCRLAMVSSQPEAKQNSEYALDILRLAKPFSKIEKTMTADPETLAELQADTGEKEAFDAIAETTKALFFVPLNPAKIPGMPPAFLWVVEFNSAEQKAVAPAVLSLLSEHYNESLDMVLNRRGPSIFAWMGKWRSWLKPSRIVLLLLIGFILSSIFGHVRQTVAAEFSIVPERRVVSYSPFDGVIAKSHVKNGTPVKKGDLILTFDMEERAFNLNNAKNEFARTSAQLDLVQRLAFKDPAKRSQVKLLELQKEKSAIEIEKNEWYLGKSEIRAESDGILDIGESEKLEGRAVRPGEPLFEILEKGRMNAEISLDERNASVLGEQTEISLYLHARPELPLKSELVSISPKPLLTEQKTYCYVLRSQINADQESDLIYGMRGVARISGERVTLGYYLFRHMVLWYRQL